MSLRATRNFPSGPEASYHSCVNGLSKSKSRIRVLDTKCQIIWTYNKPKRGTGHDRDSRLVVAFMDFKMACDRVDRKG